MTPPPPPAPRRRRPPLTCLLVGVFAAASLGAGGRLGAWESTASPGGTAPPGRPQIPAAGASTRPDRALARSCWSRMVKGAAGDDRHGELARRTVTRLLGTAHGVWLVTEICRVLGDGAGGVELRFQATALACTSEGFGCFEPVRPGAGSYRVFVRVQDAGVDPESLAYGEYPGNPDCTIVYLYRQPESWMAETLFHELLHLWFLNARQESPRLHPTGHGDVSRCQFEEEFLLLLDAFSRELAALEGRAPERLIPLWRTEGARR